MSKVEHRKDNNGCTQSDISSWEETVFIYYIEEDYCKDTKIKRMFPICSDCSREVG